MMKMASTTTNKMDGRAAGQDEDCVIKWRQHPINRSVDLNSRDVDHSAGEFDYRTIICGICTKTSENRSEYFCESLYIESESR